MGELRVNFAEVESLNFEPVPEGKYNVVVETVEVRESKSSDHPYLNWELRIVDEDYEDQRLWMITSLSPKAMFRLKDQLVDLDVIDGEEEDFPIEWDDDVDITPKEGPVLTNPDVIGMEGVAVVKNEMYEGKERNRVEEILPAGTETSRADGGGDEEPEEEAEEPKRAKKGAAKKGAKKGNAKRRRKLR